MWPNLEEIADLVIFTEEILDRKLYFLCNEMKQWLGNAPILSQNTTATRKCEVYYNAMFSSFQESRR